MMSRALRWVEEHIVGLGFLALALLTLFLLLQVLTLTRENREQGRINEVQSKTTERLLLAQAERDSVAAAQRAVLLEAVRVLSAQVLELGGQPVVTYAEAAERASTTTTSRPRQAAVAPTRPTTTTTGPTAPSTSTTRPQPVPSTAPPSRPCLLGPPAPCATTP